MPIKELCRKGGFSDATFYKWRVKFGGMDVPDAKRLLDRAAIFRGYPLAVRTDNGPEFTSPAFMAWAQSHGITHILIEPGRPMQLDPLQTLRRSINPVTPDFLLTAGAAKGGRSVNTADQASA